MARRNFRYATLVLDVDAVCRLALASFIWRGRDFTRMTLCTQRHGLFAGGGLDLY